MKLRILNIREPDNLFENDCRNLFNWRNDPDTRRNSFNTEKVKWEDHKKWFENILKNPLRDLYILSDDSVAIGTIRFDKIPDKNCAEISITIAPKERGKRYGLEAIKKFSLIYLNDNNLDYIFAEIKMMNDISLNTFAKAGYKLAEAHLGKLTYKFYKKEEEK